MSKIVAWFSKDVLEYVCDIVSQTQEGVREELQDREHTPDEVRELKHELMLAYRAHGTILFALEVYENEIPF